MPHPATVWNPYNINLPTGKHRVNGASAWLASSKPASLPFQSISPARLSYLKKLLSKYWSYPRAPRRAATQRNGFTLLAAATTRFILLCSLWYTTSALSSNTGKAILTQFRYPATLTFVQFAFVALYCLLFMSPIVRFSRLRRPTKAIIWSTLPMGMFQVGGHMFSSMAISRIPVSTVHTIKVRLLFYLFHLMKPTNAVPGTVPSFYSGRLRPPVRRLLFRENLPLSSPTDHRRYVSMYLRHVCLQHIRPSLRLRIRPRLRILQHLLQEDNAVPLQIQQPLAILT